MAGLSPKNQTMRAARELSVTEFMSGMAYLRALFLKVKEAIPDFTHQDFSEGLGFARSNNMLRLILTGKRNLTAKAAVKIADSLDFHGTNRRYWTTLVAYNISRTHEERDSLFRLLLNYKSKSQPAQLGEKEVQYFSQWYHPVIREILALDGIKGDPEAIQSKLAFPLRLDEIKDSLKLLESLGAITLDPQTGHYQRTEGHIATDQEVDSMAIVRYHQKMIEIGRESITRVAEDLRSINAVTVSISEDQVPLLKGKIQELIQTMLAAETASPEADKVYQLNIQLFPFTK